MKKLILVFGILLLAVSVFSQDYTLKEYNVWDLNKPDINDVDTVIYHVQWYCTNENFRLDRKTIVFTYRQDRYLNDSLIPAKNTHPKNVHFAWKKNDWVKKDGVKYTQDTVFQMMRAGDWKANRKWIGRKLIKGQLKSPKPQG